MSSITKKKISQSLSVFLCIILVSSFINNFSIKDINAQVSSSLTWDEEGTSFKIFSGKGVPITIYQGDISFENRCEKGVKDGFFSHADVYITPAAPQSQPFVNGLNLKDIGDSPNTIVTGASGGLFIDELIGFTGGKIGEGTYAVIYDECQDGEISPEDKIFNPAFQVIIPDDVPNIPSTYMQQVKANANQQFIKWTQLNEDFLYLINLLKLLDVIIDLPACLSGMKDEIGRPTGCADAFFEWASEQLVEKLVIGDSIEEFAKSHLFNTVKHWGAIKKDPPDESYKNITIINGGKEYSLSNSSNPLYFESIKLINSLSLQDKLQQAFVQSLERYQGAELDLNGEWALVHSQQISNYSQLLSNQLINVNNALMDINNEINSSSVKLENLTQNLIDFQQQVKLTGFTNQDNQKLMNQGFSQSDIKSIQQLINNQTFNFPNKIKDNIVSIINTNNQAIFSLNNLSSQMNQISNILFNNPEIQKITPIANAGGPYLVTKGSEIVLDGTKSHTSSFPSESTIVSWEWDFNQDGKFNDAFGSTPTIIFNDVFEGLIGLKVTDDLGNSAVSYSPITIQDNNVTPIITDYNPKPITRDIIIGTNTVRFSINTSDPENDLVKTKWFLNGLAINNGPDFDYNPTDNSSFGLNVITAIVFDNKSLGADSKSWFVNVLHPDNDHDGWNANVDCNDNNPDINPEIKEIYYNNIDDDCNPSTVDENLPPITFNQTISTLQNSPTDIILQAADNENDLLNITIVTGPENGTLGNIHFDESVGHFVATYTPSLNFHGRDSFTFMAGDQFANSNIATVNINVGISESPVIQNPTVVVQEDTPTEIEIVASSPDGHPLTFSLEGNSHTGIPGQPAVGILKDFRVTGPYSVKFTYIPPKNFSSDIFGYNDTILLHLSDGLPVPGFEGKESADATININVNNINDAPQPFNQLVSTVKETPIEIDLISLDAENNEILKTFKFNKNLTFGVSSSPSHGILSNISTIVFPHSTPSFNYTEDRITYTPDDGFTGEDSFRFFASDGISQGVGNITIKVFPTPPVYTEFEEGDIIFGTAGGGIHWYKPDGTLVKVLPPAPLTSNGLTPNTGGAFDSQGNLYVTEFASLALQSTHPDGTTSYDGTGVSKYNKTGDLIGVFNNRDNFGCVDDMDLALPCMLPESITIDKNDTLFVGGVSTAGGAAVDDLRDDLRQFDLNGNLIKQYNLDVEGRGSDWVELGPDQCTLYYTSESRNIKKYDICADRQLPDLGDAYGIGRTGEELPEFIPSAPFQFPTYALRVLDDGSVLVASQTKIIRMDSGGNIIQTYAEPNENILFSLNLDPDGKSFWSTSSGSGDVYKFDIESGKIVNHIRLDDTINLGITSIIIKGEPTLSTKEFAPMVFNQTGIINENVPTLINLTGFDIANDPLTFTILKETNSGTLSAISHISNNVSQVTYTPNSDFDGTDSFTFNANDGKLNSTNTATITITRNHAPVANDDRGITTLQGVPIDISVLANDTDIDVNHPIIDDTIQITNIDTSQTLGNVTLDSDNTTINYVPFVQEYIGPDSFNYTISDKYGLTDTAQVSINVLSSNNIPVASNQTTDTLENTAKTIQLVATDSDTGDRPFYQIVGGPSNGFISNFNSTTGIVEYHPLRTFHGQDSFTFKVHDGKDKSLPAFVNITVIDDNINDGPFVESERVSANVSERISVNVLQNDIDPNGDFLTLTNFTGPFNGTAVLNPDQTISYQSDQDFNASDVLYYRVADQFGKFGIGQLIIDVKGNAVQQVIQVPEDRLVATMRDQPVQIDLVATAAIERNLTFFLVDPPDNGNLDDVTVLSNLSTSVRYTPNNNFVGEDSFTYLAQDKKSGTISNIGTIRILVEDVPRNPPVARDVQSTVDEDSSDQIQLDASDPDSTDTITYRIESQPFSGEITGFDPSTGILVYKPDPDFNGNDSFLFKATDQDQLESNTATVRITVNQVNDPPVGNSQQVETDQDVPLQVFLTGSDPVDTGDSISLFTIIDSPANGQITDFNQNTGVLTYIPDTGFFGSDSFTFKITDSNNAESIESAKVSITVKEVTTPPPNNPPVALDQSVETFTNIPLAITLEGTDPDQTDTIQSFTIVKSPTHGQITDFDSAAGTLTYTSNNNFVGPDSFTFKVTDNHGTESVKEGIVTITVKQPPTNTAPLPPSDELCLENQEKARATQGNDFMIGSSQRDTINGLGGNDAINGCPGDDNLNGNKDNDGISGSIGNDNINGNEGDDLLFGYSGNDKINGNEGNDNIDGGPGDDSLFGGDGDDVMTGGSGKDKFSCGAGIDTIIDFKEGEDKIVGSDCEDVRLQSLQSQSQTTQRSLPLESLLR